MSDRRFTLPAFAKINLHLRVLGRRADGYHEIRTIFQTITLHDRLTFEPATDGRFEFICTAPEVPTDETNLVQLAATALRERYGVGAGARVNLEKSIPVGGGLGGGSADAATALIGLSRLWGIEVSGREMASLGARLGADVPFFFMGGMAFGTGTGTDLKPLEDAPRRHLIVVAPGVKISTAKAYIALNSPALTKAGGAVMLPISRSEADFSDSLRGVMLNDFEAVVFKLHPEIRRAKEALLKAGARQALLTGSGSSVFGIFDSEMDAGRALSALKTDAEWQVFHCSTLSRAVYRRAFGKSAALLESV